MIDLLVSNIYLNHQVKFIGFKNDTAPKWKPVYIDSSNLFLKYLLKVGCVSYVSSVVCF